jgi:predicted GNAT superfamily acetyltransferase
MSTSRHSEIRIAPLATLEEFERCVVLQLETWGYSDGDVVPRRIFMIAQRIGGQVIGAFDGDTIVGFAMSLPGFRDGHAYLHSHMLAVLPAYRNAGLGRRLKLAQRDDAIARLRPDGVDLRSAGDQERLSQHRSTGRYCAPLPAGLLWPVIIAVAGRPADR